MKARAHVIISGTVQGVFFRSRTRQEATYHNVKGWVRNLFDGRVEAIFEGEEEAVNHMIEFSKHGPRGAVVSNIEIMWEDYVGNFDRFAIRY